jgi:hypothetical protein
MSTNFRFEKPVPFEQIRNHGLEGIKTVNAEDADPNTHVCLTDGVGFLHASTGDGSDTCLVKYGLNDVSRILESLSYKFGRIISEHEEEYFEDGS